MKRLGKKLLSFCLACVMALTIVAVMEPVTAEAAVKKQTMYVGEKIERYLYGTTIKSVSSSNKGVVAVAKHKSHKFAYTMSAKKAGKATITAKYKYGSKIKTEKIEVTVKKVDIQISAQQIDGGYALLKIKNNTKQTFDKVFFKYSFKDTAGNVVEEKEEYVLYVPAGKTAYETVYLGIDAEIDYSKSSYKATAVERNPQYTYKNATDKEVIVKKTGVTEDESYVRFKLTRQNKLARPVTGVNYIVIYDAENHIIGLDKRYLYLDKKETSTSYEISFSKSEYSHPTYDHYEVITQAYSTIENK